MTTARVRLVFSALSVLPVALLHGESTPKLLPDVQVTCTPESALLRWDTQPGVIYQVQASGSLGNDWQAAGEALTGNGGPASFTEPRTGAKKFYRIAVTPFDFKPSELSPKWQLDAEADFAGLPDGPISQWAGSGITSLVQASASEKPVLGGGAVSFDGAGDSLSFPMWPGGVGQEWTFAALLKVRQGVQDGHSFFGGDVASNRVLDFSFNDAGLYSFIPNTSALVKLDECAVSPNDNWRVMVIRSNGSTLKVHFDWFDGEVQGAARTTTSGAFNVGCGYWAPTSSAPITLRYAAFFPSCLADGDTGKLLSWMEQKKHGEYPPVTVIYGGGQSNYSESMGTLRRKLPAGLGNVSLAFGRFYGSSPLNLWMNDTADLKGFEVCPFYDLSAAPAGTNAAYIGANHSGTRILDSWNLRTKHLAPHAEVRKICIFIQGETDCGDSTTLWRPNGDGQWSLRYTEPYWLADTYGRRSTAWNTAIRKSVGDENLTCIYERIFYADGILNSLQLEALARQRASQLEAMAAEPRYLLVDTAEFPRFDGIHFSSPPYQPSQVPNTGAERFCRAVVRLVQSRERLSRMSSHARLLAMRAIDSGFVLDEPKFQACETLVAAPGFGSLRSLVIPSLTAENAIDQERLRRCNLLVQCGGKYALGFLTTAPSNAAATHAAGADTVALQNALAVFLSSWGVPGSITLSEVP